MKSLDTAKQNPLLPDSEDPSSTAMAMVRMPPGAGEMCGSELTWTEACWEAHTPHPGLIQSLRLSW